jgi:hypothetical protein
VGKRLRVFCEHPKGLFLNVTKNGYAAYYLQFTREDGRQSEIVIGAEKLLTPAIAKAKAEQLIAQMTLSGISPVAAKREKVARVKAERAQTFRAVTEQWAKAAENQTTSEGTIEYRAWRLDSHILPRIGQKPVATLARADIRACVRDIQIGCRARNQDAEKAGHKTANACHRLIRQILNWACDEEIISANSAAGMKKLFDSQSESRIGKCNEATLRAF